jgi:hypothetical protein
MAQDGFAMRWDDTVKLNANVLVDQTRLEIGKYDKNIISLMRHALGMAAQRYGIKCIMDWEITDRIGGYGIQMSCCGSSVSEVDPEMLQRLPVPKSGQAVIGLYNPDRNLRCNGITDNRKILTKVLGDHWHRDNIELLQSVARPSTVFYHLFRKMFADDLVSKVGHFSGGAYDGKFAKPLGKHGLGAELSIEGHGFPVQEYLVKLQMDTIPCTFEQICAKQPYRLEAWVLTEKPEIVRSLAKEHGYEALHLGETRAMEKPELSMTFVDRGETVRYSGVHTK